MADETKRIINQPVDTSLSAGDYVIVDSQSEGTRQFDLGTELNEIKQDLSSYNTRITALEQGGSGSGLTEDIKSALLQLAAKVAYIDDDGQDYYDDLEDALYPPAPPATLSYITCVYTQSGTVEESDSLDVLKSDLVVTAHYDNGTTATVNNYTLSGTLVEGTSTITVSYGGKTTTFNVTVTGQRLPSGYTEYDYIEAAESGSEKGIIVPFSMSSDYTFETSIYHNRAISTTLAVLGTRVGGSGTKEFALFVQPSTGKLGYWMAGTDSSQTFNPIVKEQKNTIKVQPVGVSSTYPNNVTINVNGTDYDTGSTSTGATFSQWLGIFNYAASASGFGASTPAKGFRIGETIIKNGSGTIICDLVPCSNGTNYGFYDAIGQEFYYDSTYASDYSGGNWGA